MKPGPNYRMSSVTKMSLATIADPVRRGEWRRAMIQAELAAAVQPKREPRDNKGPKGNMSYTSSSNAATPSA